MEPAANRQASHHSHIEAADDIHERMQRLVQRLHELQVRYEAARDHRCVFTCCYRIMSQRLDQALDTVNLSDPTWVVDLAEHFATRYFNAMANFDDHSLRPGAWMTVLEALRHTTSSVLEDLLFPMNAHIVHDLPLALVEVWNRSPSSDHHLHDYDQVNQVMGSAINAVRNGVTRRYSPGLRWIDRIERRYDQLASDYGIRMSRALAWYNAERLETQECRKDALDAIELSPCVFVHDVRNPPTSSIRFAFRVVRAVAALFRRWPRDSPEVAA